MTLYATLDLLRYDWLDALSLAARAMPSTCARPLTLSCDISDFRKPSQHECIGC